jgi:hypothetical protein
MTIAITSNGYANGTLTIAGTGPTGLQPTGLTITVDNNTVPASVQINSDSGSSTMWTATVSINLSTGSHHVSVRLNGSLRQEDFNEIVMGVPPPPPQSARSIREVGPGARLDRSATGGSVFTLYEVRFSGGSGIRTHGRHSPSLVFKRGTQKRTPRDHPGRSAFHDSRLTCRPGARRCPGRTRHRRRTRVGVRRPDRGGRLGRRRSGWDHRGRHSG